MTDWEKFLQDALRDIAATLAQVDDAEVRAALLARQAQLHGWQNEARS